MQTMTQAREISHEKLPGHISRIVCADRFNEQAACPEAYFQRQGNVGEAARLIEKLPNVEQQKSVLLDLHRQGLLSTTLRGAYFERDGNYRNPPNLQLVSCVLSLLAFNPEMHSTVIPSLLLAHNAATNHWEARKNGSRNEEIVSLLSQNNPSNRIVHALLKHGGLSLLLKPAPDAFGGLSLFAYLRDLSTSTVPALLSVLTEASEKRAKSNMLSIKMVLSQGFNKDGFDLLVDALDIKKSNEHVAIALTGRYKDLPASKIPQKHKSLVCKLAEIEPEIVAPVIAKCGLADEGIANIYRPLLQNPEDPAPFVSLPASVLERIDSPICRFINVTKHQCSSKPLWLAFKGLTDEQQRFPLRELRDVFRQLVSREVLWDLPRS